MPLTRLVFFAVDLLHLDGHDLRAAPLEERRAKLRALVMQVLGTRIVMSDEYNGDATGFFELVNTLDLKGMVSKRKGSRYWSGTSNAWFKIKCWTTSTLQVIGIERGADNVHYALLAVDTGYKGTAFIGLPASLRSAFWRYVEGKTVTNAPVVGLKRCILAAARHDGKGPLPEKQRQAAPCSRQGC